MQRLTAEAVTLGYDQRINAENLTVEIPTTPSGCCGSGRRRTSGLSTNRMAATRIGEPAERYEGPPGQVVTAELVEQVFGMRCRIIDDPQTGTPRVVPAARKAAGVREVS